jgi:Sulfatase
MTSSPVHQFNRRPGHAVRAPTIAPFAQRCQHGPEIASFRRERIFIAWRPLLVAASDLGIADNTIVVYTTDNGAEEMTWPDGGTTPFRGEKATNWEGGFRVPTVIRWPGVIKPGTIYNDIFAHMDFLPTFLAAAGDPDVVAKCLKGDQVGNQTYKVHLDGYNLIPFFTGEVKQSPRKGFIYWSDDADVFAIRVGRWKVEFLEQLHEGLDVWRLGFEKLRTPKMFDMLADPFERADSSLLYDKWMIDHIFLTYGANAIVAEWLQSFKEFPPRQKPASFNLDDVMRNYLSRPSVGND